MTDGGSPLRVGIVGCGLIGHKRAKALRTIDTLVAATDIEPGRAAQLAAAHGGRACVDMAELLALGPDVVVVATPHDQLAQMGERALAAGAHVLIEKPAGLGVAQIERLASAAQASDRKVKVGFNHRFHPALTDLAAEVQSGEHGALMHLRARYGHGGRLGYEREWRARPERSGGGELVDQGMHVLDLAHWLAGPLPLHSSLLRTHFWDTDVEDNAVVVLGDQASRTGPWALLHVTWTEWKNMFSLEVYCRTAKLQVDGLVGSYGPQRLTIYRMAPELGPPKVESRGYGEADLSWAREWTHFAQAIHHDAPLIGDLDDARYAWTVIEQAYVASDPYSNVRRRVTW